MLESGPNINPIKSSSYTSCPGNSESFDLFKNLKVDFEKKRFPWVGEYSDFALGYLSFASILHAHSFSASKPVGSFVIGNTATGKTQFLEALCKLFPREKIINLTTASTKSLIYECRENSHYLNGKIVFVEELSGIKNPEIQYLLRVLLTKGYAVHHTVTNGEAENIEIHGAISLQSTGLTTDSLRDDTMNRLVIFESDDSSERTGEVISNVVDRYSRKSILSRDSFIEYQGFFKNLKPYPVVISYGDKIKFDTSEFVVRRSSKIFMDLLSTVALINQDQRKIEDGVIVSEFEDFLCLLELTKKPKKISDISLSFSQKVILDVIGKVSDVEKFTYNDVLDLKPVNEKGEVYKLSSIKKGMIKLRKLGLVKVLQNTRPAYFSLVDSDGVNRFGII